MHKCTRGIFTLVDVRPGIGKAIKYKKEHDMKIEMKNMYCDVDDNKVATLYFNRPPLNLFTLEVFDEFSSIFTQLESCINTDTVRSVILTTAIPKAFSAGDDIKGGPQTPDEAIVQNDIARNVMQKILNFPIPVIAAIDGYALGGGLVLAMMTDYVISSDRARFGFGEINFAMFPNWSTTYVLGRGYPLSQMKHLLISGENFGPDLALEYNFVQQVVASGDLLAEAQKLAALYASKAPIAVRCIKTLLNTAQDISEQGHYALESMFTRLTFDSEDVAEGTRAFSEKRDPVFRNK